MTTSTTCQYDWMNDLTHSIFIKSLRKEFCRGFIIIAEEYVCASKLLLYTLQSNILRSLVNSTLMITIIVEWANEGILRNGFCTYYINRFSLMSVVLQSRMLFRFFFWIVVFYWFQSKVTCFWWIGQSFRRNMEAKRTLISRRVSRFENCSDLV